MRILPGIGLRNMNELKLTKEIYGITEIQAAVGAYDQLANIRVLDAGDYWVLAFERCTYDAGRTTKEFENYVIDLMNKRREYGECAV